MYTLHVHGPQLSVLCGLISYAGSSGSGQRGPHCRMAKQSPQGQALCSRSPGANPLPCLPASVHMSSYGRHMWSCRKADAVFPFVKSSFWKAVSILRARVESVSKCKGERAVNRQQAQLYCAECCNVWSLWGYADLAKRWHVIILRVNTCVSHSSTYSTKTHTVLMWTCL